MCYFFILTPITNPLSFCLTKCSLPREWKVHKICPNLKVVYDVHCANNYRPISYSEFFLKFWNQLFFIKSLTFFVLLFSACNMVSFEVNPVYLNFCTFTLRSSVHSIKTHHVMSFSLTLKKHSTLFPIRNSYLSSGHLALLGFCGFGSKTTFSIDFIMSTSMVPLSLVCLCFQGFHKGSVLGALNSLSVVCQ